MLEFCNAEVVFLLHDLSDEVVDEQDMIARPHLVLQVHEHGSHVGVLQPLSPQHPESLPANLEVMGHLIDAALVVLQVAGETVRDVGVAV